jgi:hypothetical protein
LSFPRSESTTPDFSPSSISLLFNNNQERRSFDFFCQHTVTQLSGVFDSGFWSRLLLQVIHHEPAVRHAAVALGALHESFEWGHETRVENQIADSREPNMFALQQYSKAITLLMEPINRHEKQAADAALITCVLFVYFEEWLVLR